MKTVIVEIEMDVEDDVSNLGIAEGIEQTLIHNDYGQPNYVICRNKYRHPSSSSAAKPSTLPDQTGA